MNLDELQKPTSINAISKLLEKHYGWTLPINEMSNKTAEKLLETVKNKLNFFRNSKYSHVAEQSQAYNVLLLTEQLLTKKINEATYKDYKDAFGPITGTAGSDIGQAAGAISQSLKSIPGANVSSPVQQMSVADLMRSVSSSVKIAKEQSRNEYQKILTQNNLTASEFEKFFKEFYTSNKADHIPVSKQEDFFEALSTIEYKIKKMQGKDRDLNAILSALKGVGVRRSGSRPSTAPVAPATPASPSAPSIPESKGNNMRFNQFKTNKKKIYESAMADAEVVLAAKDIADRFQDMVGSLGKMINEEMPALVETIRDTMGAEQADAYNSSATQTINSALENIRTSKEALDSAARTLAGEETGAQPMDELGGEEIDTSAEELDQVPAAASGGDEEPLGRGER